MVGSSRISNSYKLSCMLSLHLSMKMIRSRTVEKKWRHRFPIISVWGFFRRSRAANSAVGGPIRPKFEPLRALMHVIVTCKYEKEPIKNSRKKWRHCFSHHNPICYHGNQWLDLAEFQTHPSSHVCNYYLQV